MTLGDPGALLPPAEAQKIAVLKRLCCAVEEIRDELRKSDILLAIRSEAMVTKRTK